MGLLVLIGRAEFAIRGRDTWQIAIEGYDPRDLLHGHYLQYRYRFNWQGEDRCGLDGDVARPERDCCLCLTRSTPRGIDPPVHAVACDEAPACDGWLRSDRVAPPLRYFVPEQRARDLELALREREAALELTCGPEGEPAILELYLDGQPWR
jgi:hypothetical protein